MRAAGNLALPAWIFGVLGLVGVSLVALLDFEYALVSLMAIGLAWMWLEGEEIVVRTAAARGDRLPDEILDLLVLVDGMIDALERGEDAAFDLELGRFGLELVRLQPAALRHLEDRGADPLRLRQSVCRSNLAAESPEPLSPDRRRALHQELVRFAATARGRPCGDPYRSRVSSVGLLGALLDPSLGRTRRRYLVILTLLAIAWGLAWNHLAALSHGGSLRLCNPTVGDPNCRLAIGTGAIRHTFIDALALVPMMLLGAAAAARSAAWRSWAVALPESEPAIPEFTFEPAWRWWLAGSRRAPRIVLWLLFAGAVGVVLESEDWAWNRFRPGEQLLLLSLVTLGLVVLPQITAALERRAQRRGYWRRFHRARVDQRALLSDLFALRRALADAAPARPELLAQLADTLADAESLGELAPEDRDRVVARLRAATQRGPALDRGQRHRLLLDVEICEILIAGPP